MEVLLNLLKTSVIVGGVVAALILLKPALNRRYHAKWKYYVWLVLALVLLWPLVPVETALQGAVAERAPIQIEVPQVEVTYAPGAGVTVQEASTAPVVTAPVTVIPGTSGDAAPQESQQAAPRALPVEAILLWLWATGAVLFLLYHAVGTLVFYRRCRRWGRPAERSYIREGAAETARELGIRREIPVWVSSAVDTPMMVGLLCPQLLLPTEQYGERELGFILRHELTHLRRHDLWYKLALLLANAVHWFNPLAYLLVREANADMELTCDDAVMAGADGETRRAYSETLLAAIHRQKGFQGAALSTHFYGGAAVMKERFRNILGGGRRKRGVVVLCIVLLLTVAAGCAVAFNSKKSETLTAEELQEWQERLNDPEWNGFVTHMYGDVKYLSLAELLYNGAGITHEVAEAELAAYLDAMGMEELQTDLEAITAQDLDAYLREHTGLTLADFASGLDWVYVEEYDTYYFQHGDTNFTSVEVVSGTRTGNTVALEISAPGSWDAGMAAGAGVTWENGTLTITDDKVVSYCNDLYAAAETQAREGLQELADSSQESLSISRHWLERLQVWNVYAGEKGVYYEWRADFRLAVEDMEEQQLNAMLDYMDNGVLTYVFQMAVRLEEDGTVNSLESGCGLGYDNGFSLQYEYLGLTFGEYCRYHYDYSMELQGRQMGWPGADNRLVVSVQNGGDQWTQTAEDVAKGWLMSWGDDLDHYEVVYAGTPDGDLADQDQMLRVWSTGGRCVVLALDHVLRDYGIGDWADTVTYWEVMGYNLESGSPLPQERLGQDGRSATTTLDRALSDEREQMPCFLYSGGGDYGLYAWSLYIPYEQWSCNYLVNRWCPNQSDMSTYMEVRAHNADYTPEVFYDSYVQQFEEVWTNQAAYGTGSPDTVTVAWARGYQSGGGGRYTESYLFTSGEQVYEVLWTYTAEGAEEWGARMQWSADTFAIIGDNQAYIAGELKRVKPGETLVVEQKKDADLIEAGTYLVLGNDNAFRLEGYALPNLQAQLDRDFVSGAFDEAEIVSITRAATYSGSEIFGDGSQDTVEVFLVDWGAQALDESLFQPKGGMTVDENGFWGFGLPDYLILVHNGEYVTKTAMLKTDAQPYASAFPKEVRQLLTSSSSAISQWSTHPAIFYDRAAGELYAVSTHPAQITN